MCDRLLQPFTRTITLFIQLTDNERADLVLFTLCICFAQRETKLPLPDCGAPCNVLQQCVHAGVVGGDGGIVCPRPDAFRVDVSSRP